MTSFFSLSLFPQKPVGAWKYCNPSFLYCLVPLYLFAFSCLEGWRWGNKSCSFHFSLFLKFPLLLYFVFLFAVFTACRPPSSRQVILFPLCHFPLILITGASFLLFASMLWADETLSLSLFWTAAFTQLHTNRNITLTLLNNSVSDFSQQNSTGPEFQHFKVM